MSNLNHQFSPIQRNGKSLQLSLIIFACILSFSCRRLGVVLPPPNNNQITLSASGSTVILAQINNIDTAISFNWTTGTNKGTGAAISYVLQIDKQGNNFSNPVTKNLGQQVYSFGFTNGDLNDSITTHWQIPAGDSLALEARVIANVSDSSVPPQVSQTVSFSVKTYIPITTTLYIIGDAAPNGWSNSNAAALTPNPNVPGEFDFQGTLTPGNFKFITTLGSFLPSYNKGADSATLVYRTSGDQPDNQFTVTTDGVYKITVNLLTLTVNVSQVALPAYSKLWIIGDATPLGWGISTPDSLVTDPDNAFIFKYNQVLNAGEFKIATAANGSYDIPFYEPLTNHPSITDTTMQLTPVGGTDVKWYIANPGAYKIYINLLTMSVHINTFQPYSQLWIVGDATPAGWNIDTPTPLVATPGDPYTFTYTGYLNVGEFKIPVATGDWNTNFFRPYSNHPPITDTKAQFVTHGTAPDDTDDYKWYISTAGNYKITFNQLYETIHIQPQ